ncbi:MAG: diaminopimelate decarboxylase [Planctomycetes bacterium]|nr:diaminopimelate decarboxylase [Planctomycetota bacterium]
MPRPKTKRRYQSPELHALPAGPLERPPAAARRTSVLSTLAGHDVRELVARFGSPLCVVDETRLRDAYRRMDAAFRARWPDTHIGCSVKTNYLSAVVAVLRSEGAWGEVVSGFEYRLCRDLGIPGNEILFNGPYKTDEDLELAFREGAKVHIDSDDELERVIALSRSFETPREIGLRCSIQLNYPPWDKFGFGLETGHALEAARAIAREPKLRLAGLHAHVGTYLPDPGTYARSIESLIGFALRLERELDLRIGHLDVGGGYATRNTLHHTMLPGEALAASAEDYAEAITAPLRKAARQFRSPPRLFLEPGRFLVDEAVSMITTVRAVKRGSGQQKAALVDCGVHILPTAFWYDHEIRPVEDRGGALESYRMVGPLCMQIDCVRQNLVLPSLRSGDLLVIQDVGAYNFSQSMQFIYMRPTYVMAHAAGVDVIRERESDAYVREPERLPAHLVSDETRHSLLVRGR